MSPKYHLAQIGNDFKNGFLTVDEAINESFLIGQSSRDTEVSNLQGEIKELVGQLKRMCVLYGDCIEMHSTFQREESADYRHSQELISKYTKS